MMSNILCSFDQIHDATVWEYHVDFKAHSLNMTVGWSNGSGVKVCFSGLLAHHFENVIEANILFDIEEVSSSYFLQKREAFLTEKLRFGFPINKNNCRTVEQLAGYLEGYRIFQIDSSLGLIGFVIAKDIQINEKSS